MTGSRKGAELVPRLDPPPVGSREVRRASLGKFDDNFPSSTKSADDAKETKRVSIPQDDLLGLFSTSSTPSRPAPTSIPSDAGPSTSNPFDFFTATTSNDPFDLKEAPKAPSKTMKGRSSSTSEAPKSISRKTSERKPKKQEEDDFLSIALRDTTLEAKTPAVQPNPFDDLFK